MKLLKVFAVIDEEDLINEGVVVKKSRVGELRAKCSEFLDKVTMWHEQYAQPIEAVLGVNEMKKHYLI